MLPHVGPLTALDQRVAHGLDELATLERRIGELRDALQYLFVQRWDARQSRLPTLAEIPVRPH